MSARAHGYMPPSPSPPPDRFQREIDDIIRLAERRLERQSFGSRVRRSGRRIGAGLGRISLHLPAIEVMAGWGLALLLVSWLLSLPIFRGSLLGYAQVWTQAIGIALLALAIVISVARGRGGGSASSENKLWRGERVSYGNPYGEGFLDRLRRMFRR
jgi:hypothetical protein